ncbi:MAG TPA: tetratricopeptide repeat protein [Terriglobales bacterium]|nr:tetratricopeptide repeat protein [Terriglobales bacterium]
MKRFFAPVVFSLLVSLVGTAQQVSISDARTPAELRIAAAERVIAAKPGSYEAYNDLALGWARRARETSDTAFYAKAGEAVRKSLELMPGNFEAQKLEVWLLLGGHEFAQALEKAKALNQQVPDDLQVYGFLTDANTELGNYQDAIDAAQWMLNLRPGNVPGLTRAAYLRELSGDVEGALELMEMALQSTPPNESEDLAWTRTQMGHLELMRGNPAGAEAHLMEALGLFPGYHYALANLGRVRAAQGRRGEAVDLLRRRYEAAPHAENLYDLAEALERAGRQSEARRAFAEFEAKALKESEKWDNANRELVFYYADHARKAAEALKIAAWESSRRHDVHTLDAYAWALYRNGRYAEASKQMRKALEVGVRELRLFQHAASIARAAGHRAEALEYLRQAQELDPAQGAMRASSGR